MVAGIYGVFGSGNLVAVRLVQAIVSLLTTVVIYRLGTVAFSHRVGLGAAAGVCFYPSFLGYNNLLLSEVLFTFLVPATTLACVESLQRRSFSLLLTAGVLLGLAALTRSVMFLFAPVLAAVVFCAWHDGGFRRWYAAAIPVLAMAVVIAPWSYRNTVLHRTFVVIDVMGGRNAMMGNYDYTPLERSWATIGIAQGEGEWYRVLARESADFAQQTQGQRDKLALRHAVRFVLDHPVLTLQRDVVKFFNFWQLERSLIAGAKQGFFGDLSRGTLIVASVAICGSYAAAILLGIFGLFLVRPTSRGIHWLLVAQIAFPCLIHTLIFAHERYHLPVMPFVLLYAAAAVSRSRQIWQVRGLSFWLAAGSCMVLVLAWARELVFVDFSHAVDILGG
jgi:4-amino-4-deoxy-L-arabinose transferase-like glycosyltransferase